MRCGAANADHARFCHACGAAIATAGAADVRKVVTVLFADVVEFTPLGESADPETLRRIMSRFFAEMQQVIEQHGGTVEKFIGDEIMAVFGVPVVHEDDALRAARAAGEMLHRLDTLNEELERTWGARLQIRIGLNTGEVVAGDASRGHGFVTGDAVNVAKRLEQAASAGQILMGKTTYPLVKHAVGASPLQSFRVKGKSEAVARWQIDTVDSDRGQARTPSRTPLVGRDADLSVLRAAAARAIDERRAQLVTVVGPPGIGKSRLATELCTVLEDEATTVVGRCLAYGEAVTFWPLTEILRQVRTLPTGAGASAELADQLQTLLAGGRDAPSEEILWATRRLFETLAQERPTVVVFDDLHWAESTLLDLIEYLAEWTRDAQVLFLCLGRPELLETRPNWAAPRATVVALEPLADEQTSALVASLDDEDVFDAATRDRIADAAEGNPFFAEQLAAMVREGGELGATPPSIQVLLAARLDRLPQAERAVIERAAVCGRDFWRGAVAHLVPDEVRRDVAMLLMALVRKGFVRPDPGNTSRNDDAFKFEHGLVRDAAYDGIAKEARAALHERFAEWLEQNAADRVELEEIIGYHLEQAYRSWEQLGPVDERTRRLAVRAGEFLGSAGRRAFNRDDMPAALKLLDRAIALMTDEEPARLELVRELSSGLWAIGEVARAEALLDGLIDAASAAGDRRIEWYALLDRAGRREDPDSQARFATDAIAVFEALGDDRGLAQAWRQRSIASARRCCFAAAEREGEESLRHARRAGDSSAEARAIDRLCTALLYGPTPAAPASARCAELLEASAGNALMEANVASSLTGLLAMEARFDEARAMRARAEEIFTELGMRLPLAGLMQIVAEAELLAGDADEAERSIRRCWEIVAPIRGLVPFVAALLTHVLWEKGEYEEAERFERISSDCVTSDQLSARTLCVSAGALLEAHRGGGDRAVALAREAVDLAATTDALNLHGDALRTLAHVQLTLGHREDAEVAAREAAALYDRKGNVVAAARARALLAEPVP